MRRGLRLLRTFITLLVAAAIVAAAAGVAATGWVLLRSLPQTTGTIHVKGLDAEVTVKRDAHGFVNVYASSPHDLFLAQGYVHAQERMWQMEVFRHIGAGRLSELFGKSQLDTDRFIRTLGWYRAAERSVATSTREARDALQAYSDGVNAWLADNSQLSLPFVVTGLLSGTGGLDGYRPQPWSPADSAVFAMTESWVLAGNYDSELFRFLLARKVDPQAVNELYAPPNPANPTIVGGTATGVGSNEWAVAPARSKTGFALLANDPHLTVSMPSIWFVIGLHCRPLTEACPYDVAGVSFPSVPGVILGHNRHIAWGATNAPADVEDLFLEKLAPGDPSHYEYEGKLLAFETRTETIKVAGSSDATLTVRSTVHGPVIDDVVKPLAPIEDGGGGLGAPGYVLALRWTALVEPQTAFDAFLQLDRAPNYQGFRAALRLFSGPCQNFVYADDGGHVAFQLAGHIPIRSGGADGSTPAPGWDGSADWTGDIPYDRLPRLLDPASGSIVAANNVPVGADYPYFLGREWDAGYRAARIDELLSAGKLFSLQDFQKMQLDDRLLRADPVIAAAKTARATTSDGEIVRSRVAAWDGTAPPDSLGAAAGEVFAYRLVRDVFDDELGAGIEKDALARMYVGGEQSRAVLLRMLADVRAGKPPSRWWDDVRTPGVVEPPAEIITRALDEAGSDLRTALGDPSGWTWGSLHRMVYREQTLGSSGILPLELILDRGPLPVGGSGDAVNDTVWSASAGYPDPYDPARKPADLFGVFETVVSPSYRGVYDAGNWDDARIVSTTGQSEQPLSGHFADLIDPWLRGELLPFPFSDSAVEKATTETLTLSP